MRTIVVGLITVVALSLGTAHAQSKCDAGKRKEYGKKVFCLAKVDAKADKTGGPIDSAKEQRCIDKFAEKCAKAEAKDDCTGAVKSCAELMTEADTCRAAADGPGGTTTTLSSTTTTTLGVPCAWESGSNQCAGDCPSGLTCGEFTATGICSCGMPCDFDSGNVCVGDCLPGLTCGEFTTGICSCGTTNSTTTTSSSTTTTSLATGQCALGTPEACQAFSVLNSPCYFCCLGDTFCSSSCLDAYSNGCADSFANQLCAVYVNDAGCGDTCCP